MKKINLKNLNANGGGKKLFLIGIIGIILLALLVFIIQETQVFGIGVSPLSPFKKSGTNVFLRTITDKVGIGNTAPTEKLTVTGGIESTTTVTAVNLDATFLNLWTLPTADGTSGQFLSTDGNGVLSFASAAGSGDVTDVFDCSSGDCNTMTVGTSEYLVYGTGYIDANRFAGVTTVDGTEFGYLNNVTSAIQTQLNGKEGTLTNSAGLASALDDETGTGLSVFSISPTLTGTAIAANINASGTITATNLDATHSLRVGSNVLPFLSNTGAILGANQTISDTTWTKINMNNEKWDKLGEFDPVTNYRFTAQQDGVYFVSAQVYWSGSVNEKSHWISIYKNGSTIRRVRIRASGTGTFSQFIASTIRLNATDFLEVYVYQDIGGDAVIYTSAARDTFFGVTRVQ